MDYIALCVGRYFITRILSVYLPCGRSVDAATIGLYEAINKIDCYYEILYPLHDYRHFDFV